MSLTHKITLDNSKIMVELAVIQGISRDSPISDKFYSWLSDVVTKAL